jgi:hypothetical protein
VIGKIYKQSFPLLGGKRCDTPGYFREELDEHHIFKDLLDRIDPDITESIGFGQHVVIGTEGETALLSEQILTMVMSNPLTEMPYRVDKRSLSVLRFLDMQKEAYNSLLHNIVHQIILLASPSWYMNAADT